MGLKEMAVDSRVNEWQEAYLLVEERLIQCQEQIRQQAARIEQLTNDLASARRATIALQNQLGRSLGP